jgi:autotransporter-associated beta strand protein
LTKLGAGTLTLSGTNTQTGATTISAGTLAVGATGSIARSAGVVVAAGAVLDVSAVSGGFTLGASQTLSGSGAVNGTVTCAGTISPGTSGGAIGTLTFSNAPVLKGVTAMSVNRASGVLANAQVSVPAGTLAFGGTLTVTSTGDALQTGDSFRLFNAASYAGAFAVTNLPALSSGLGWSNSLAANGSLTVVTTVSLVPTNLVWGVSAAGLTLSWPPDHTGWRLQAQTNPLDGGLNTNWADVSGGSLTNNVTFPMDPATGSVFYRLVYP